MTDIDPLLSRDDVVPGSDVATSNGRHGVVPSNDVDPIGVCADEGEIVPLSEAFFSERGALVVARLGDVLRRAGHIEVGLDGRLWRYRDGVYRPDGETWARAEVRQTLGERWIRKHGDEVVAWLRAFEPTVGDRQPLDLLNVANGLLHWRTGELRPHTPDVLSTVQLPVEWRPDATCTAIDVFLGGVLGDAVELIVEFAGYMLYPGNPLRRALLLLGPGRNGKSVLLAIMKALAGAENVSTIPLQLLAENRFAAAELFGRLANISGDLDARAVKQTDVFKMATGQDAIMAERKYGNAFSFTPFATFLFAANEAPITSDQTEAWFDRWLVVPLDRRIPDDQVDPHLTAKLTTSSELEGFLVRAVAGLRAVMERGRFDPPKSIEAAGEDYRERLDTVRAFVNDACLFKVDAWVPRSQLYKAYRSWAIESGRLPLAAVNFNDRLRRDYPETMSESTRRGIRGWQGIGLVDHGYAPLEVD